MKLYIWETEKEVIICLADSLKSARIEVFYAYPELRKITSNAKPSIFNSTASVVIPKGDKE
jgi:hypothetical protein